MQPSTTGHSWSGSWPDSWLRPVFSSTRVRAVMSSREGGFSKSPFNSLNLATHVGDDPPCVATNRDHFAVCLGLPLRRLNQVHGTAVVRWTSGCTDPAADSPTADACVTSASGVACEIQMADCLPVLLADRHGRAVAAAHAGWRGLAAGVLQAAVDSLCREAGGEPQDIEAWLGPCIGPQSFEVGEDVLLAVDRDAMHPGPDFVPRIGADGGAPLVAGPARWLANLPALARARLRDAGLREITGNDGSAPWCTLLNPGRFFSYRRDGRTGRMSAVIWLTD